MVKLKTRINVVFLVSLITGLVVAGFSLIQIQERLAAAEKTIEIAVPARDILQYQKIYQDDLTTRSIPVSGVEPGAVLRSSEAVGKFAQQPLYKDELIRKERLTETDITQGYDYISVNVDLARGGGAGPGDVVDVYKIVQDTALNLPQKPVATGAVVVAVLDGQGNNLYSGEDKGLTDAATKAISGTKPPAVIKLAVKPHEAGNVVDGAVPGATNIVLVVKNNSEGGEIADGTEDIDKPEEQHPGGTETGTDSGKTGNN